MKNIGTLALIGGLGLIVWQMTKKPTPIAAAPALLPGTSEAVVKDAYTQAGYTGKQLNDIVKAVVSYEAEMERIKIQPAPVTQTEIMSKLVETSEQATAAVKIVAEDPGYAPFTPEQTAAYLAIPPKDIYGNVVYTKTEALEAANRQYRVSSRQTDPGIRASMMLIAEGMYQQATLLP